MLQTFYLSTANRPGRSSIGSFGHIRHSLCWIGIITPECMYKMQCWQSKSILQNRILNPVYHLCKWLLCTMTDNGSRINYKYQLFLWPIFRLLRKKKKIFHEQHWISLVPNRSNLWKKTNSISNSIACNT